MHYLHRQGMDILLQDRDDVDTVVDIDASVRSPGTNVAPSSDHSGQNDLFDLRNALLQYIPYPLWSTSLIDTSFENNINTLLQQYPQSLI